MAFTHFRSEGIFIKKENRGEADQLLYVFTKNFGKVKVLGRSLRKIKSKLRSGADLFYLSEIEFIQGKTYKTLTDANLIKKHNKIREEPERMRIAYGMAEALDLLTGNEEKDIRVWKLLKASFQKLSSESLEEENYELLYSYFLWSLFYLIGFKPELYKCVYCGEGVDPYNIYFSPLDGGISCEKCYGRLKENKKEGVKKIKSGTIKVLRVFLGKERKLLAKLQIDRPIREEIQFLADDYLKVLVSDLRGVEIKREFSEEFSSRVK